MRATVLKALGVVGGLLLLAGLLAVGRMWWESRLPSTYNVMDYGSHDFGEGPIPPNHEAAAGVDVASLKEPGNGPADARFTLTAKQATIRLPSGRTIDALTFNGKSPGPELRVRRGQLVEVTLRNEDVEGGVSIHWHGVDVPNAEDGVAGVTQDAVEPGDSYTYRFRTEQQGTFWYHTHQSSANEVRRGLFGAFVIEPDGPAEPGESAVDLVALAHDYEGTPTLNGSDEVAKRQVRPGTPVRLRVVNSDNTPQRFTVAGTPFRVLAIDGTDLNEPQPVENTRLVVAGGGRYDIGFTMPASAVELRLQDTDAGIALSPDGRGELPPPSGGVDLDPASYGRPRPTPFDASSRFDRTFVLDVGRKPGFFDGRPGMQWTINGEIYPDVPTFLVEEGDLVKVRIENNTGSVHPMHLHGHHALVLSRDEQPVTGSPWWTDTLDVEPNERYEIAFRANNPGLWMDHCHNLKHAADGLTMHLAYAGVTTSFRVGGGAHNQPE